MDFLPDKKIGCPYTGFAKTCRAIVIAHACPKFVKIDGLNPNTGEPVSKFGCIDSFQHMLMIENSAQQRSTGAAVEMFRNKFVRVATHVLVAAGAPQDEIVKLVADDTPPKLLGQG
jgi:hypothetical protein